MTPAELEAKIIDLFGGRQVTRFAKALGVTRVAVHRWLNGSRPIPEYVESALELALACPVQRLPERWR